MTPRPAAISDSGPWSCQVVVLLGQQDAGQQSCDNAADDRADNRNPAVGPVGAALAGDREEGVRNARAEVTTRVDGVSGRSTERDADAEDQQADAEGAQPAHEQQNCRADYLREEDRSERHSHLFPTSVRMSLVARGTPPSLLRSDRRRSIARTASLR